VRTKEGAYHRGKWSTRRCNETTPGCLHETYLSLDGAFGCEHAAVWETAEGWRYSVGPCGDACGVKAGSEEAQVVCETWLGERLVPYRLARGRELPEGMGR